MTRGRSDQAFALDEWGRYESIPLTERRLLIGIGKLWNGEVENGEHLLFSPLPSWKSVFVNRPPPDIPRGRDVEPLDLEKLRLYRGDVETGTRLDEWFDETHLLYRSVPYNPTFKVKQFIDDHYHLPHLGLGDNDSFERLPHRFLVGQAVAFMYFFERYDIDKSCRRHRRDPLETYSNVTIDGATYCVDVLYEPDRLRVPDPDPRFGPTIAEAITGHHNTNQRRHLYYKLVAAGQRYHRVVLAPSTADLIDLLNDWERRDLTSLDGGTIDSNVGISRLQDYIKPDPDVPIDNLVTPRDFQPRVEAVVECAIENPPACGFEPDADWQTLRAKFGDFTW